MSILFVELLPSVSSNGKARRSRYGILSAGVLSYCVGNSAVSDGYYVSNHVPILGRSVFLLIGVRSAHDKVGA